VPKPHSMQVTNATASQNLKQSTSFKITLHYMFVSSLIQYCMCILIPTCAFYSILSICHTLEGEVWGGPKNTLHIEQCVTSNDWLQYINPVINQSLDCMFMHVPRWLVSTVGLNRNHIMQVTIVISYSATLILINSNNINNFSLIHLSMMMIIISWC